MGAIASQTTSLTIVFSTVYSDADLRKHQSSASLTFVREIHREPVNYPHKWPVKRKMIPFDNVIMSCQIDNLLFSVFQYLFTMACPINYTIICSRIPSGHNLIGATHTP